MVLPLRGAVGLALLAGCFTLSACIDGPRCGGGNGSCKVEPQLEVVDASVEGRSPCAVDNLRDCAHDFGDVVVGAGGRYTFRLINESPVPATVTEIALFGDQAFTLVDDHTFPLIVQPFSDEIVRREISVRFAPSMPGPVAGDLRIASDAINLERGDPDDPSDDERIVLELSGNGIAGASSVAVEPEVCDFGRVLPGTAAFCDVTISNHGQMDLQLRQTSFSASTPLALTGDDTFDPALNGFGQQTMLFLPVFVAPGTATTVRLFANPPDESEMTGAWQLDTNDIASPVVSVPLLVTGAATPTAVAEVHSVNGTPSDSASPAVQPLDDVVLTCEDSVPSTTDGEIVACEWEIRDRPAESSVTLTSPSGMTTGFQFSSAGGTFSGLDVAGSYEIGLTVTDDLGLVSTNVATVVLNSIPQDAVHVQLTWDDDDVDLDLHLIKDGGPWCSALSCYYGNCLGNSLNRPEWDDVPGETHGDPSLDINDLSGFGPENINIDVPVSGDYRVGVHTTSTTISTEVEATVKVFINGALAYEQSRQMLAGRDFWEVSEVRWNNGGAIVFPVGDYETSWSCP